MKMTKEAPYNQKMAKIEKKSVVKTAKSVNAVAKDTNKTRRKMVKPTKGK